MHLSRPRRLMLATLFTCTGTFASVNTASLVSSAMSPDCISWRISGICYWLFCTPFGCTVKTSVKVTHYIPEAVVSAYVNPGDNPWTEMSTVSATAGGAESLVSGGLAGVPAGGGRQEMKAPGMRKQNLHFYYGDAYGHPATSLIGGMVPGYSCRSAATPFVPYFVSAMDALAWRTGIPESLYPEALTGAPDVFRFLLTSSAAVLLRFRMACSSVRNVKRSTWRSWPDIKKRTFHRWSDCWHTW